MSWKRLIVQDDDGVEVGRVIWWEGHWIALCDFGLAGSCRHPQICSWDSDIDDSASKVLDLLADHFERHHSDS